MAIKFQTNTPKTLCFPYADYLEVSGQYGTQFLYTVGAPRCARVISLS